MVVVLCFTDCWYFEKLHDNENVITLKILFAFKADLRQAMSSHQKWSIPSNSIQADHLQTGSNVEIVAVFCSYNWIVSVQVSLVKFAFVQLQMYLSITFGFFNHYH